MNNDTILGHPKGLFVLFFTEMWERFSYYGMRAILILYIYSSIEDGGLGWTKADAIWLYGWYTMLVYVMSIPGGILADKFIGQKKAVMVGGLILCAGHGILAVEAIWAFYTGLALIILGVGALKPNISTMVGGLYPPGDERRDKGFTIFYIGINIGAFLSSITVAIVADAYGWHYGFGLAGIGMLLGQLVYFWGQKYLVGVGDLVKKTDEDKKDDINLGKEMFKNPVTAAMAIAAIPAGVLVGLFVNETLGFFLGVLLLVASYFGAMFRDKELVKVDKDRIWVMLISFLIVVVFWGAFEQAGGLLNIYADEKIDRNLFGWEVPAGVFQSVNAFFIMIFGTAVAWFWAKRRMKNKEVSSLFKMAIGTMIMGAGFLCMTFAAMEAGQEPYGKASMYWLIGAYLLHTIGELCASPVALSFITKLAPVKYASVMMGVYFAATGFGNKLAGSIGEAAQNEPIKIELVGEKTDVEGFLPADDKSIAEDKNFSIRGNLYLEGEELVVETKDGKDITPIIKLDKESKAKERLKKILKDAKVEEKNTYHATLKFEKDVEAKKVKKNKGDGKEYSGEIVIEEVQNKAEFNIFTFIFGFTVAFGLLVLLFLKKLKALTHGAEEVVEDKE